MTKTIDRMTREELAEKLWTAERLIRRLDGHEGAEGWSKDLREALDAYAFSTPSDDARARFAEAMREVYAVNAYLGNGFWGPAKATVRAEILSRLAGKKVPKSRAGFNAFRNALYEAAGLNVAPYTGWTENALENEFARRCAREVIGG